MADRLDSKPPILVTGAHRTGTTWVGKILAASGEAGYISEPFNVRHRPGVFRAPLKHWYTYICADNESEYLPAMKETLAFQYHLPQEIASLRSIKDIGRLGRDWSIFLSGRMHKHRPLLKDPFAAFSVPWFANRLGCQIVVTVRHPTAFISSLKRLGWAFDFSNLLEQPYLMRDWLGPFEAEMQAMVKSPEDLIGQGSLLWRAIYHVINACRGQIPRLQVVRHEDLSLSPIEGFRALYVACGLNFTPNVEKTVLNSSSSENPKELSRKNTYGHRLDSRSSLANWKRRLSESEIERIRQLTCDVAKYYYPDQE